MRHGLPKLSGQEGRRRHRMLPGGDSATLAVSSSLPRASHFALSLLGRNFFATRRMNGFTLGMKNIQDDHAATSAAPSRHEPYALAAPTAAWRTRPPCARGYAHARRRA